MCPKLKRNNKIGVFDSGLGGLSVLKSFLKILPHYSYIYLGDTARVPYGDKSAETVYHYSLEAIEFLFKQGCNLVIIACNTASALALRKIQQEWLIKNYPDRRVLGVIIPLAEAAARHAPDKKIGIIGTNATINSRSYPEEIKKLNPNVKVIQQSAPLLVPLIEGGHANKPETNLILSGYLKGLKKVDTLILACTHYPYLQKQIKKILGPQVWVPSSGDIIAHSLVNYLKRHDLLRTGEGSLMIYTTDTPILFQKLAEKFLRQKISNIQQIKL